MRWRSMCVAGLTVLLAGCGGSESPGPPKPVPPDGANVTKPDDSKTTKPPDVPHPKDSRPLSDLQIADLIQNTGHADAARRKEAEDALLAAGAGVVVPELIKALDDENWHVRAGVVCTLSRFGKAAAPSLTKLREKSAKDESEAVRDAAAFAIDAIEGN